MPTFDVSVDFDVYCAVCGAALCNQCNADNSTTTRRARLTVEPCQHCLDAEQDKGFDKGAKWQEEQDKKGGQP